ncbi:hypothetical protein TNCV_559951 [Trichonephila clavipes]|nr:hypothetical protein TNCV_559951 [Trichonephila clavipes]
MISEPRECQENIPQTIMSPPPAWTRSGNDCRVVPFRGFTPYTPTSICPDGASNAIHQKTLPVATSGRPAAVLACKF